MSMDAAVIELTRGALKLARDWMALPGNERERFVRAIAERAAAWTQESESIDVEPTVVVRLVRLTDT